MAGFEVSTEVSVCERLGFTVRVHDEAFAMAARAVVGASDEATARTAGGWLVSAVRQGLVVALANPEVREIAITPDSLTIARAQRDRRPPDDPPDDLRGWNAAIILTPP